MTLDEEVTVKSIETKVLNGRKINLKVTLEVQSKIYSNENVNVIKEINNLKNIQILNNNINVPSLLGEGSTKVYAKDTIGIDNIDNLAEILKVNFSIINKDMKTSYNKILAKADAKLQIMYLTEDDRINTTEALIPVVGFIEMPNVSDNNYSEMDYKLKNILIKPNNTEEHSIYVEAEIEISSRIFEDIEINVIEDLYSPNEVLEFTSKNIDIMSEKETIRETFNIREKQSIPEIGSNKIYDVEITPVINSQNIVNNKIIYECNLSVNYIFASTNSLMDTKLVTIPFTFSINSSNLSPNMNINTNIDIIMQNFVVISDGYVEAKIDLEFNVQIPKIRNLNLIDEIQIKENRSEDLYSMIIYFVKPGDTLWKIAKNFRSTIDEIARINGIEDINKIDSGMQLLIPKYINRKVLV